MKLAAPALEPAAARLSTPAPGWPLALTAVLAVAVPTLIAFNVAPFWLQPKEALGIVGRHLAPDGAVHIFWDARHTQSGRGRDVAERLTERIRVAEFSVDHVLVKDLRPVPAVCVIGRPGRAAMADG